jgi:hypothetical protein
MREDYCIVTVDYVHMADRRNLDKPDIKQVLTFRLSCKNMTDHGTCVSIEEHAF